VTVAHVCDGRVIRVEAKGGAFALVQRRALVRIFNALGASAFRGTSCGAAGGVLVGLTVESRLSTTMFIKP
jgi:hypothetical protein